MLSKPKRRELIYGLPLIFFICLAVFGRIGIYNDTAQYIAMHIHRDPLYCLFLWLFRTMSGDADWYIKVVVYVQNILAAVSVIKLSRTIRCRFELNVWKEIVVGLIVISPHVLTPIAAQSGLILTNSIMSEGITFSLFYLFVDRLIDTIAEVGKKAIWEALVFALLLSLARGQLMVMLIVWFLVAVYMSVFGSKKVADGVTASDGVDTGDGIEAKRVCTCIGIMLAVFVVSFVTRGLIVKSYNLTFNNYFMSTTMSDVSMLSNILYATDAEAIYAIEDDETREFAIASFEMADSLGYNYKYCEKGLFNRAIDIENTHDRIKFECIDECWRYIHDAMGGKLQHDYEYETAQQDRIAGNIIKEIWPKCFGRWLYGYISLVVVGLIRSVAFVNPVFNVYAFIIYALWLVLLVYYILKRKGEKLIIRFALLAMILVLGNVFATAAVIMCLSRYMIYMLPMVYISVFLLITTNKGD